MSPLPPLQLREEHVKLILPSVGLFGFYFGAFFGLVLLRDRMELGAALGGLLGGLFTLFATAVWLHPLGRFASVANSLAAFFVGAFIAWWIPWPFVQNLVIWGTVFLWVWREERAAMRPAARPGPPRS